MLREPICAVVTCFGYGDFLRETAKYNAAVFDKIVVMTSADDEETRHVCRNLHLTCVVTEDHKRDGVFSKGRVVERGLQHLPTNSFIIQKDADIVFPSNTRKLLELAHLRKDRIYGVDRFMVRNWDQWKQLEASGWLQCPTGPFPACLEVPRGFELGARYLSPDGYTPLGFTQMWHRNGSEEEWFGHRVSQYPSGHSDASREDVQKSLQFDRRKRELIPELFVAHLESEPAKMGANWNGRTTKRFGPNPPTVSTKSPS